MNRLWIGLGTVLALLAIGTYFGLRKMPQPPPPAAPIVSAPSSIPTAPAISHPLETPPGATDLPPLAESDDFVRDRLGELFGAKNLKTYLRSDNFVRRSVVTIDNLPRALAPPRMWPIRPTPGRFTVEASGDGSVVGAKNAARYAPFVRFVESVDAVNAVAYYQRLYPLFQGAYEALGYPGKYFNDRLVAVIDLLLKTPETAEPLRVELPEIQGTLKPTRPWLLYRFADPALEELSGGQKMLLRSGRENEKRLKAKLAEIRKLIAVKKVAR